MNAILSRGGILAALLSTALIAPAHASSININTDGSWNSFDVDEFMSASGGLEWIDAVADEANGYSGDGSALSFTFTLNQAGLLTVVDAGFGGDAYRVNVNGVDYFTSTDIMPSAAGDGLAYVGLDFDAALADGVNFSYLQLALDAGTYTVTGALVTSALDEAGDPLNASVGGLQVSAVPVPAAVWLLGSALLAGAGFVRRRRA